MKSGLEESQKQTLEAVGGWANVSFPDDVLRFIKNDPHFADFELHDIYIRAPQISYEMDPETKELTVIAKDPLVEIDFYINSPAKTLEQRIYGVHALLTDSIPPPEYDYLRPWIAEECPNRWYMDDWERIATVYFPSNLYVGESSSPIATGDKPTRGRLNIHVNYQEGWEDNEKM